MPDSFDPRWGDDPRDRHDQPGDVSRGSRGGSDPRDRDRVDPRDVFVEHVRLPRGMEREHVHYRGRDYTLRGSESRTLSTVGAFRVIPANDLRDTFDKPLDPRHGELWHLRNSGLVQTVRLDRDTSVVTLTKEGRGLLESHRRDGESPDRQAFHHGVQKPRELKHDAQAYRAFLEEAERLREAGANIHRIVLENELKAEYQEFLQARNRDRDDSDGRPDRDVLEIRGWAQKHELPCDDQGRVQFPDVRIEYDLDGRDRTLDVEVMTPHYRALTRRPSLAPVSPSTSRAVPAEGGAAVDGDLASSRSCCDDLRRARPDRRQEGLYGTPGEVPDDCHAACRRLRPTAVRPVLRNRPRAEDTAVLRQALRLGYASMYDCRHNRARIYHLNQRALYRAIGEADSRLRRPVTINHAIQRLMVLDAIVEDPDLIWLGTAEEKTAHLRTLTRIAPADLPHVTVGHGDTRTSRYFPDRVPIGIHLAGRGVVVYVVTDPWLDDFRVFLERQAALLRALPAWTLRIVVPPQFPDIGQRAKQVVWNQLLTPLKPPAIDELRWYFEQARTHSAPSRCDNVDERFYKAREAFSAPRFKALYKVWKQEGEAALAEVGSHVIDDAVKAGAGQVETLELGHRYGHLSPLVAVA